VLEFYRDAYPVDRKASRSVRLRKRTIDLLRILEDLCVRQPEQNDLVSGWFDESIALKLTRSGIETLGQLASTVAQGGDWYSVLPQVGPAKANRIASHLQMLIGAGQRMQAVHFSHSSSLAALPSPDAATKTDPIVFSRDVIERLTPITFNEHPKQDCSDRQAIHAWITRTAGSLATSKSYLREARRLQLWLHFESGGKTLADMTPLDCERYVLFLTNVPDRWISTCRAAPGDPGWAPFRGKLGNSSLIQAVRVVGALFNWLHTSCHLSSNVWIQTIKSADLVSPVDPTISGGSVFHPSVNLLRFLDRQAPSLSRSRMRLICILSMNDGIRPTELLNARIGDLVCQRRKWRLPVTSGSKSRVVKLSKQAMQSIVEYSIYCGYKSLDQAPANLPLAGNARNPLAPIGYQSLYEFSRMWIHRAEKSLAQVDVAPKR
jgi:site-specific recombinase XerD